VGASAPPAAGAPGLDDEDAEHLDPGRVKEFYNNTPLGEMKFIKFQDNMYCSEAFVHWVHWTACICKASFASIANAYNASMAQTLTPTAEPIMLDPTGRQVQKAWVYYRLLVARGHQGIRSHM